MGFKEQISMSLRTSMAQQAFSDFMAQTLAQFQQDSTVLLQHGHLPTPLGDACHYVMAGHGKRVRPLLVACAYASLHPASCDGLAHASLPNVVRRSMLAVEFLHGYSLVHDDLPCMDDDNLRRGRATCHIAFDEATALLVGDVLQTLAFEALVADIFSGNAFDKHTDAPSCQQLLRVFAPCARRMVIGQMLDLNGENQTLNQTQLQAIHTDKTGALIEASVLMGAMCAKVNDAQANHQQTTALTGFAKSLGLAFQVQDDILDVISDNNTLGKPTGSDEKLDKSTYVKLMGVAQAKTYAQSLFDDAKANLTCALGKTANLSPLMQLTDWLWRRNN